MYMIIWMALFNIILCKIDNSAQYLFRFLFKKNQGLFASFILLYGTLVYYTLYRWIIYMTIKYAAIYRGQSL